MKKIIIILFLLLFLAPFSSLAQTEGNENSELDPALTNEGQDISETGTTQTQEPPVIDSQEELFIAKVVEIIEEKEITREDQSKAIQQNLKLIGLEGTYKGKEIIFNGISEIDVVSSNVYKKGDKVLVSHVKTIENEDEFYIQDFVRTDYIYILCFMFAAIIIIIGKKKGFMALLSLVLSFIVILKLILPFILKGYNPVWVATFGGVIILGIIIYVTEGFNVKSHLATISVFASLLVTSVLSVIFTNLTKITGMAQEESSFLIGETSFPIDFKGLLLAGIIIGAIGVLDDIIIGQIQSVSELKKANPNLSTKQLFRSAFKVGNSHLSAIINTLFLTYSGAALPLLLLFVINSQSGLTISHAINNEVITTEIIRTLVGSIGVALSMPISTYLASLYFSRK